MNHRRNILSLLASTVCVSTWTAGVHADSLVHNGDFDTDADGWTLIDHFAANWYCQEGLNTNLTGGWDGNCGWFYLNDFDGNIPETNQLITGLTPGQKYTISGYFARDTANHEDALFRVLVDDTVYFEAGGEQGVWTQFSFTYTAEDADALLRFQSQINGDDAYCIDHISVTPVETCYADCNHDGQLDLFDFLCFVNEFNAGCP